MALGVDKIADNCVEIPITINKALELNYLS